jgi:hypothetical protein
MAGILKKQNRLTESDVRFYLSEIVVAIEKLHKVGIPLHCSPLQ